MPASEQQKRPTVVQFDKELELPDTLYIRDIENKVFQGIVLQCLASIPDISLIEGNFIDSIFSRGSVDGIKGITTEQDSKSESISVKIEVDINYGISIPEKAEEIQSKVSEELTRLTGLHVSSIHVVFKNIANLQPIKRALIQQRNDGVSKDREVEKEYSDEWD